TATAVPNTPPSSRIMLLIPASLPAVSSVAEPTTEFWADGIAIEIPTPATINGTTRCENGRPGLAIDAIQAVPPHWISSPLTISGRSPIRSTQAPTTGATRMNVDVQTMSLSPV